MMYQKILLQISSCAAIILCFTLSSVEVLAHSRWIVPSHTILSGDEPDVVTIDFSISNDIFHPDFAAGGLDIKEVLSAGKHASSSKKLNPRAAIMKKLMDSTHLRVTEPDSSVDDSPQLINFSRKSVASVLLNQSGTYRLSIEQNPIFITTYKNAKNEPQRAFGSLSDVKGFLPTDAKDIHTKRIFNRVETYVTRNDLSWKNVQPVGKGLEVKFVSHPNELFVDEPAKMVLLMNGKPAPKDTLIRLTRGGTRYRNNRDSIEINSKKNGEFIVSWGKPGLYLLEAEIELTSTEKEISKDANSVYITLEVNPE